MAQVAGSSRGTGAAAARCLIDAFRQIAATQARAANDGRLVTPVTLPPRDGVIVLRMLGRALYRSLVVKGWHDATDKVRGPRSLWPWSVPPRPVFGAPDLVFSPVT